MVKVQRSLNLHDIEVWCTGFFKKAFDGRSEAYSSSVHSWTTPVDIYFDDESSQPSEHLKEKLEDYIQEPKFEGKVKLVRNARREGLIRTRIIGAQHASGDVLLWLDAHCEVGINWLPPLLTPIAVNR